MAAKKAAPAKAAPASASGSRFKGKGSKRINNRLITVFGVPKTRKTTSVATLPLGETKWIAVDPNAIATLEALGRLPHADDIHEFSSLSEVVHFTNELLDAGEKGEDLGFKYLVLDSITQLNNWHQMVVSSETTQRYLGEEAGKGWQQFNAEMGKLLDNLAKLTMYITVVVIGHVKLSDFKKKGAHAALSLPPQMAERLAQLSNWLLYKTFEEVVAEPGAEPEEDEYISGEGAGDTKKYFESVLWTKPCGNIIAAVNSLNLKHQEPGSSLWALMQKAGLAE